MERSYDKEIGLRELVLQQLSNSVNDLMHQNEENPKQVHTEENKYCILLTICLERCITFGMKESGFFAKRDFFEFLAKGSMQVKDEYLEQDFHSVQQLLLHKTGKARAWIRKTINECHLAGSLYSLASDREFIKSWYEPYGIMSTNAINDLYKEIEKLEQIHFQFNLKDRLLDQDELFALPPSQYRGMNKLERLREDTDTEDDEDHNKKRDKKSKRSRKRSLKRNKSRRNANLNEVNQSIESEFTVEIESTKSSSPKSDNDKDKNKRKKRKKRKKTKEKQLEDDHEHQHEDDLETNGDYLDVDEDDGGNKSRKQSLQEWQQQHTADLTPQTSITESITPVNVSKSEAIRITTHRKGSISERISSKLASIPIKINRNIVGDRLQQQASDNVFRISSPSDYHTSFKWNDAAKDNSSQIIEKLYDDEHNESKRHAFPDPMSYVEQIENDGDEEIALMDDKELEQEISTLIENAPNESNDDYGDLSLSSEQDIATLSISGSDDIDDGNNLLNRLAVHSDIIEEEQEQSMQSSLSHHRYDMDKRSFSILSDTKKEEILSKNDEYIQKKKESETKRVYAPECQTFIHHLEKNDHRLGIDVANQSLSMYLQSDNYFDDENQLRDRRKKEQDKESKKRMQREQDVMRGNDSVYIQKSLNSSGMNNSGGTENKPLDSCGDKVVLPSTGIILDETVDKSIDDFFVDQNGECFSCGDHLGSPQISRQCYYTQRLYCALCMDGTHSNVIPGKLIHNLDSRRYPISANSKRHLDSMYDVPAVPLSKIELPSWYIPSQTATISLLKNESDENNVNSNGNGNSNESDDDINIDDEDSFAVHQKHTANDVIPNQNEKYYKLIKLGEYLEILSYIKQYFYRNKECHDIHSTIENALRRRPYLLDAYCTDKDSFGYFLKIIDEHKDELKMNQSKHSKYRLYGLISMRDMFELFNKDLLNTMHYNQKHITSHIKSCAHCKKRSYGANVQFVTKFADVLQ